MPILFFIVLIDLIGFGIIIPLLPFYGEHFQASPAVVGLLMAVYSATQFVSAPFWGRLSDRIGRRPVLLATLGGTVVAYVWLGFAESLWMLFAARAVGGLMAGNIGTAFAYVADVTTPQNRAKGMGLIGAAFGLGFILGPALGGILAGADPATADFRSPALAAAAMSAAAFGIALATLKESLSPETRRRLAEQPPATRRRMFLAALGRRDLAVALGLAFVATFVFAGMESTFAMWSRRQFGWGPEQNGYIFAFVGLLSAAIQAGLVGMLARRFGEGRMVAAGALLLAGGLLAIPLSTGLAHLLAAMAVAGIGFSLISPALNSLVSLNVGETERGGVMGVTRSVTTLARVAGPAFAGALFSFLGKDWPYYAGAALMIGVFLMALAAYRSPPAKPAID